MAWKDGELADSERAFLSRLAQALSLGETAVERALREMSPDDGKRFAADRLLRLLMDVHWDAVQLASGALCSEDLVAVTPAGSEVVARVGLERVEVMGLCTTGLVARFQEGAAFLAWSELVTYTRERGLGNALKLHTEDGRSWSLVDQRLSGVSTLLDRLLDLDEGKPRPTGRRSTRCAAIETGDSLLALFDLDRTLIDVNSGRLWVASGVARGAAPGPRRRLGLVLARSLHARLEAGSTARWRPRRARSSARPRRPSTSGSAGGSSGEVRGHLRPGAAAALARHREQGDRLVLATSGTVYAARAAAAAYGLDEVVATTFEVMGGRFTGKLRTLAVGAGKATAVRAWA